MNLKNKKLLILGGMAFSNDIIHQAHKQGIKVYVTDYNEKSPAFKFADKSFMVSTTDVDAVVELIKKEKIDGIITGFVDLLLPYYQEICEKTGLPCYLTKEQITITTDKEKFKNLCKQFNVPVVPEYQIEDKKSFKYPILLKPADNSGGRGIFICHNENDFNELYLKALSFSKSQKVLIERYMTGKEVSIFYILIDGKIYLTAMGDRYVKKTKEELIPLPVAYTFPSVFLENYQKNINEKVIRMFESIGVKNGMIFIQSFIEDDNCVIYEMGYRLTGSLEYKLIFKVNGINPLEMMINFAISGKMTVDKNQIFSKPNFVIPCCNITFLANPGVIGKIYGINEIAKIEGVIGSVLNYQEGDTIPETAVGTLMQVVLRIFAYADTQGQLKDLMETLKNTIKIEDKDGKNMLLAAFDKNELFIK
jgi:biotin carboxylase